MVEVNVGSEWIKEEVQTVNIVDFQKEEKRSGAVIPEDKYDMKAVLFYFLKGGNI